MPAVGERLGQQSDQVRTARISDRLYVGDGVRIDTGRDRDPVREVGILAARGYGDDRLAVGANTASQRRRQGGQPTPVLRLQEQAHGAEDSRGQDDVRCGPRAAFASEQASAAKALEPVTAGDWFDAIHLRLWKDDGATPLRQIQVVLVE